MTYGASILAALPLIQHLDKGLGKSADGGPGVGPLESTKDSYKNDLAFDFSLAPPGRSPHLESDLEGEKPWSLHLSEWLLTSKSINETNLKKKIRGVVKYGEYKRGLAQGERNTKRNQYLQVSAW